MKNIDTATIVSLPVILFSQEKFRCRLFHDLVDIIYIFM